MSLPSAIASAPRIFPPGSDPSLARAWVWAQAGERVLLVVVTHAQAEQYRRDLHTITGGTLAVTRAFGEEMEHPSGGRVYVTYRGKLAMRVRGRRFTQWTQAGNVTLTTDELAAIASVMDRKPEPLPATSPIPKWDGPEAVADVRARLDAAGEKAADELRWAMQLRVMRGEVTPDVLEKARAVIAGLGEHLAAQEHEVRSFWDPSSSSEYQALVPKGAPPQPLQAIGHCLTCGAIPRRPMRQCGTCERYVCDDCPTDDEKIEDNCAECHVARDPSALPPF